MNPERFWFKKYHFLEEERPVLKRFWTDPQVREYLGGPISDEEAGERADALINCWSEKAPSGRPTNLSIGFYPEPGADLMALILFTPHHDGKDVEVSYMLLPEFWGQGVMANVLPRALEEFWWDVGAGRVIAETQSANSRSCGLLERVGFVLERSVTRFGAEQFVYTFDLDARMRT